MASTHPIPYSRPARSRDALTRQIYFNEIHPNPRPLQTSTSKLRHSHHPYQLNKSMWQLLRENKQLANSITQEQKQMMVLEMQQKKLLRKLKQHREKNSTNKSCTAQSTENESRLVSETNEKPRLSRTNTSSYLFRREDKNLHQTQKKNRISNMKREKQLMKAVLLENRFKSLAEKRSNVGLHHSKKSFLKDQMNMIQFLEEYKMRKEKERERLEYEEIQMKSRIQYVNLVNKRHSKLNRVEELKVVTMVLDSDAFGGRETTVDGE